MRTTTALAILALLTLGDACTASFSDSDGDLAPPLVDGSAPSDDAPPPPRERCNGRDDDGDGKIDEGCPLRVVIDVDPTRASPWRWVSDDGARVLFTRASSSTFGSVWLFERGRGERLLLDGYLAPVLSASATRVAAYRPPVAIDLAYRFVELDLTGASPRTVTVPSSAFPPYAYEPNYVGDELALTVIESDPGPADVYFPDRDGHLAPMLPGTPVFRVRSDGRAGVFTGDGVTSLYSFTLDPTPRARRILEAAAGNELYPLAVRGGRALVRESAPSGSPCRVSLVELATGATTPLDGCPRAGALGDDVVVLEADPPGGRLRVRALDGSGEWPLSTYPSFATAPSLTGSTLSWIDNRAGTFDVYQMDLSDFAAGDFFPDGRPR